MQKTPDCVEMIRITDDIIKTAESIVAIGRGFDTLKEFCNKYGSDIIDCFLTDNKREQNGVDINGRSIPARDMSCFFDLYAANSSDAASGSIVFVIMDDYFCEVYNSLYAMSKKEADDLRIYYYLNRENEIEFGYRERYKDTPLEKIIVFRSGPHASQYVHGMDYGDNARALFEYMLDMRLNERYELVWIVKDPEEFIRFKDIPNVNFISFEWAVNGTHEQMDEYYRVMCLAKYVFFTDAYGFARNSRADQIRIQLWHGCGFKTRVNFTRCEKRYELMPVIGSAYKKIHERIYGLRDDQVIVTGYPKDDWLFHPVKESFSELFDAPEASRYIMWMPTFREAKGHLANLNEYRIGGQTGLPVADSYDKLQRLNDLLVSKNAVIIVKLHPFQKRDRVNCEGCSNIVLIENDDLDRLDIPVNRLLGKADALISDYSSAAVDYLILDRPIGFLLEDLEEYGNSRGFVFEPIRDWLPGAELFTFEDMMCFVSGVADGRDFSKEKRQRVRKEMHSFSDDKSSERLVKYLRI